MWDIAEAHAGVLRAVLGSRDANGLGCGTGCVLTWLAGLPARAYARLMVLAANV
jgi:hypothetical protein